MSQQYGSFDSFFAPSARRPDSMESEEEVLSSLSQDEEVYHRELQLRRAEYWCGTTPFEDEAFHSDFPSASDEDDSDGENEVPPYRPTKIPRHPVFRVAMDLDGRTKHCILRENALKKRIQSLEKKCQELAPRAIDQSLFFHQMKEMLERKRHLKERELNAVLHDNEAPVWLAVVPSDVVQTYREQRVTLLDDSLLMRLTNHMDQHKLLRETRLGRLVVYAQHSLDGRYYVIVGINPVNQDLYFYVKILHKSLA